MSLGSTGACSRPRRSVRSRSRRLLRSGSPSESDGPGEHLHLRVGLAARAPRSRRAARVTRPAARSRRDRCAPVGTRLRGRRSCRARATPRTERPTSWASSSTKPTTTESPNVRRFELERERDTGVGGADDQRAQTRALAVTLTLEREQAGLETDAAATEKDQQRRDRRRGEDRQASCAGGRRYHASANVDAKMPVDAAATTRTASSTDA